MWETLATVFSAIIAFVGLLATWLAWRRAELRREEVLAWGDDVISELQKVELACRLPEVYINADAKTEIFSSALIELSILVERGRIFFRNKVIDDFGNEKAPAYQGYRPLILDQIIIAHQIALKWPFNSDDEQLRLSVLARACKCEFVSMMQKEVGRQRTSSTDTASGGNGVDLEWLMGQVSGKALTQERLNQEELR